ncbi:MAG: hypothetical protein WC326_12850 [Candidatus Delongbacteria bacterium]
MIRTAAQEIEKVEMGRPHLVILGAGASYASTPTGDRFGKHLPLMSNLIEILELDDIVSKSGIDCSKGNFETFYSELYLRKDMESQRRELEERIHRYFSSLELPEEPTIYDHLVLSLREKDYVATFNWDPFLVQAIKRNGRRFPMPRPLFLHGNVAVGYCRHGHSMGDIGSCCSKCGESFVPTRILYPVAEKNYQNTEFIDRQWRAIQAILNDTFMVTVFGYGAPATDASAVELLKTAWGGGDTRVMEEIEIIDIRDDNELEDLWSPFIHSHHYRVHSSFYDSWISKHPRRTGEAYIDQFIDAMFIEDNPIPRGLSFTGLWDWFQPLSDVEFEANV